jgi:hypothetical protein
MKNLPGLKRAYPALLLPLLTLCLWCGGSGGGTSTATSSGGTSGPPLTNSGPSAEGGVYDDDSGPGQEDLDASHPDTGEFGDAGPCDDTQGDLGACSAPDGSSPCLTPSRCQALTQLLSARSAAAAMSCLGSLGEDCSPALLGDCFLGGAAIACNPAAAGSPPCDAVATLCASGDPSGLLGECLILAGALSPAAKTALSACLGDGGACDPESLSACAAALIP